jgi:hypothetical protein
MDELMTGETRRPLSRATLAICPTAIARPTYDRAR